MAGYVFKGVTQVNSIQCSTPVKCTITHRGLMRGEFDLGQCCAAIERIFPHLYIGALKINALQCPAIVKCGIGDAVERCGKCQ